LEGRVEKGADHLLKKYLQALKRLKRTSQGTATKSASQKLWRLFVEHPWFERELQVCARHALKVSSSPAQCLDDVQQDARMFLGRTLRRWPDLHMRLPITAGAFAGLLRTVISHDCQRSIRRMRHLYPPIAELQDEDIAASAADLRQVRETLADVSMAMERLPTLERRVLTLFSYGYKTAEIAEELGLSMTTAHRVKHRAFRLLQDVLESGGYS
jgi:RNA polymerase sigma factor (sigma-70 family)